MIVKRKEIDILTNLLNQVVQDGKGRAVFVPGEAGAGKSTMINNFVESITKSEKHNPFFKILSSVSECNDTRIPQFPWKKLFIDLEYNVAALSDRNISDDQSKIDYKNFIEQVYVAAGENWLKLIPVVGSYITDVVKIVRSITKDADAKKKAEEKMKSSNLASNSLQEISYHIIRQFRKLAGENILVLFIKDIHWFDPWSLELFYYIIQDLYNKPYRLVFIASYREEILKVLQKNELSGLMEDHPVKKVLSQFRKNNSFLEIPVNRFDNDQIIEFFELRYPGNKFSREFTNELQHITNGNAYFLEEITRYLEQDTKNIYKDDNGIYKNKTEINYSLLPGSIDEEIIKRYNSLPDPELKTILEYASVMGEDFSAEVIIKIMRTDDAAFQRYLDRLKNDFGIIEKANISYDKLKKIYKFNHNLFQKCIYNKVTDDGNNIDYHKRTADSIREFFKGNNIRKVLEQYILHLGIGNLIADSEGNLILEKESLEDEDFKNIADEYLELTKELAGKYEKSFGNIEAIKRCNIILGMAQKFDDKELEIDYLHKKGNILKFIGEYDKAEQEIVNSHRLADGSGDRKRIAQSKLILGNIYQLKGKYSEALANLNDSLVIFSETGDDDGVAGNLISIGNILKYLGEYENAKNNYEKVISLSRKLQNKRCEGIAKMNIGNIYYDLTDYENSRSNYIEALEIFNSIESRKDIADAKKNIGNVHFIKKEYDEAQKFYDESMEEYRRTGYIKGVADSFVNKGSVNYSTVDYDNSFINYYEALRIFEILGEKKGSAFCYRNLGLIYQGKEEYDEAMEHFLKAKSLAEELSDKKEISLCESNIGEIHLERNEYEEALKYFDKAIEKGRVLHINNELCSFLFNKANVFYKSGKLTDSESVNTEAMEIAKKISKIRTVFNCRILSSKIIAASDKEKSAEILKEMLNEFSEDSQLAEIYFELFKLNNSLEHKNKALDIYSALYSKSQKAEYKRNSDELKKYK